MTAFDSDNLNTAYSQRELDMLPQTGTTKAQTVGDIGNPITGELISREAAIAVCRDIADEWADHTATVHLSDGADECVARLRALPAAPGAGEVELDFLREAHSRLQDAFTRVISERDAAEARLAELEAERDALVVALKAMVSAVCGHTGFAECVRRDSGFAYTWPSLDEAEKLAIRALANPSSKATLDKLIADAVQADRAAKEALTAPPSGTDITQQNKAEMVLTNGTSGGLSTTAQSVSEGGAL